MVKEDRKVWKANYFIKITSLFDEFPKAFIVKADNVGSKQMQQIRQGLRGKGVILMGKNTMMRKAIRGHLDTNPGLEKLLPAIKHNVGFVFTKDDLSEVRGLLLENKRIRGFRYKIGGFIHKKNYRVNGYYESRDTFKFVSSHGNLHMSKELLGKCKKATRDMLFD